MDMYNLVSLVGVLVLLGGAWAVSTARRQVCWRTVAWGMGIQFALGALVFRAPGSKVAFERVNDAVVRVIDAAKAGQALLFGPLADPQKTGFVLALQALPLIVFFAALMGLLYYWRIMPGVIRGFAWVFSRLMRISGAESFCAASNIFVGIESTTAVRPYLAAMTRSELCTILTAGMATVASSTMAVYVCFLGESFPSIAGHLVSASLLSAPAAIVMAKILVPETSQPLTLGRSIRVAIERESNAIEAVINGAMAGVRLLVGVVALLIAFLGLIALAELLLAVVTGTEIPASGTLGGGLISELLGYVFYPLAVVIGVPPADAEQAGRLFGLRLVATEIPAYQQLATAISAGQFQHPRSPVIIAYVLCGFAHVASLAIFVGGTAALVPERRKDLSAVALRALLAATLACLITGAVAGIFYHESLTMTASQPAAALTATCPR